MGVTTIQVTFLLQIAKKRADELKKIWRSLQTYLVDSFTEFSASALAAITVTRCIDKSLIPLLGPVVSQRLGLGWGNSPLAFLNLARCGMPYVLFVWGEMWREKSLPKNM